MTEQTDLLVVGAGPYAYSAAAHAQANGIATTMVGTPMSFWRDRMPADMYLRSGPDWYLDADRVHTFEAFFEDRGLDPADHDPIPIGLWLDMTDWFAERAGLEVDPRHVERLDRDPRGEGFVATMDDGTTVAAERVLAAPGVAPFVNLPDWADQVAPGRSAHTFDLVEFDALDGARVVVIGGRQSAYEWAALLCDHGAASVDVVHRHPTPAFAKVSWAFVDPHVEQTLAHRGWWRGLPVAEQQRIAQQFWQVGRLTLEHWLVPRLRPEVVTSRPETHVVAASESTTEDGATELVLSDGTHLTADFVVHASGYKVDVSRIPWLAPVLGDLATSDGFPVLSEGMETSVPGLSMVGFVTTKDFGPFYGFTKGCPSAARIAVGEMLRS